MKTFCKDRTPRQMLKTCNVVIILLMICIVLLVGLLIYDLITGQPVERSRVAIICADVCILCLTVKNRNNAKTNIEDNNN